MATPSFSQAIFYPLNRSFFSYVSYLYPQKMTFSLSCQSVSFSSSYGLYSLTLTSSSFYLLTSILTFPFCCCIFIIQVFHLNIYPFWVLTDHHQRINQSLLCSYSQAWLDWETSLSRTTCHTARSYQTQTLQVQLTYSIWVCPRQTAF